MGKLCRLYTNPITALKKRCHDAIERKREKREREKARVIFCNVCHKNCMFVLLCKFVEVSASFIYLSILEVLYLYISSLYIVNVLCNTILISKSIKRGNNYNKGICLSLYLYFILSICY